MSAFRHPGLDRPVLSLRQLQAINAIVRRYLPANVTKLELEVLPVSMPGDNPAPLEVRATVSEPEQGSVKPQWGPELMAEMRAGWPITEFQFPISFASAEAS
ncbi:hypothetical protein [Gemmatimonas sp.]|jgi:hypothetical protein|uniref:hypothetical protein n=1 Tax=Gemmatimonas sp. TaxID=1962908 RepID=UPI0025C4734D|nr:hypothetical protein [Gemmatimonas sp.]MCA2982693.1 hypothetical protein [Gemmatimonas sp.]MCA2995929.1 hypothetical protein [Gemmatimonas sp.]